MTKIDPLRCLALVRAWASGDGAGVLVLNDVLEVCDLAEKGLSAIRGVEAAREALKKISEGDVPRPVGQQYLPDRPSKNDKCIHGRWMYADCDECTAAFALAALSQEEKVTP